MIYSRRLLLAAAACLSFLLAACKPPETAVRRGDRTQTLELGNLTEPTDLDPQVINSQQDFNIVFTLLEGLTTPDAKDLHPTPGAAQSWDISADGTVYTFHLRPNAKWSDGAPVNADDFLFAYRRMLSPKLASEYSYMLYVMKNAENYNKGKVTDFNTVGVKALDPLTLQITLNSPTAYFLSLVGHHSWFPIARQAVEKTATAGPAPSRRVFWWRPERCADAAIAAVRAVRPGAIETTEQARWVAAGHAHAACSSRMPGGPPRGTGRWVPCSGWR